VGQRFAHPVSTRWPVPSRVRLIGALVALAAIGCSGTPASTPAASAGAGPSATAAGPAGDPLVAALDPGTTTVSATVRDYAFDPQPVQAKVGDVITWKNDGPSEHTATLDAGSCGTPNLATGESGSLTFSAPGTYAYRCDIHPSRMKGTIVVTG